MGRSCTRNPPRPGIVEFIKETAEVFRAQVRRVEGEIANSECPVFSVKGKSFLVEIRMVLPTIDGLQHSAASQRNSGNDDMLDVHLFCKMISIKRNRNGEPRARVFPCLLSTSN